MSESGTRDQQAETKYILMYGYKIFRLLLVTLLITYFLGLPMYIISEQLNPADVPSTFYKEYNMEQYSNYEIVIRCMYFILTTINTVGFGDFLPFSDLERAYVMIVELFGVAFFSYCMGNFIEIIAGYEKRMGVADKISELQTWLTLLNRFNEGKPLNREMTAEIEDYFAYFLQENRLETVSRDSPYLRATPKYYRRQVKI